MNMPSRNEYIRAVLPRYLKGTKEEKTRILDELVANTGYHRDYAIWKLRDFQMHPPAEREDRVRKKRARTYGPDCLPALKEIWEFLEYPCGERLQPYLPVIVPKLEQARFLVLAPSVRSKLLQMSISTIDRLLKDCRRVRRRQWQATTKPGTLLKHQIPVRQERWPDNTVPGYAEVDFVAHCGDENVGDYVSTLSFTDIATTWMEHGAIWGKSQARTVQSLETIAKRLPFTLHGLDPDNDGQFINWHLKRWCDGRNIGFTRSRAYRKNDNAHIEQKNWSTVRRVLGYQRIDTSRQWRLMQQLYAGPLRDWQNFFQPTLKLKEKIRRGARVTKRHDVGRTPYQRVLESPAVPGENKAWLRVYYASLDPVAIKRQMDAILKTISTINRSRARPLLHRGS